MAGANRIIYTIRPPHLNWVFVSGVEKVYTVKYVAEDDDSTSDLRLDGRRIGIYTIRPFNKLRTRQQTCPRCNRDEGGSL